LRKPAFAGCLGASLRSARFCLSRHAAVRAGVPTTGILYGVPPWARIPAKDCSPAAGNPGFAIFCKAKDPKAYGRFVGFIASRFDGLHGHGRVADFVIHNEVNSNIWFDIGCGDGKACDTKQWLDDYAANYNAAYDRVVTHQPAARAADRERRQRHRAPRHAGAAGGRGVPQPAQRARGAGHHQLRLPPHEGPPA